MSVKYPQIRLKLVGEDGNAFSILGRARKAMKNARLTNEQIIEFSNEAKSGDYNNLLYTCMQYFNCDGAEDEYDEDASDAEWDEYWTELDEELERVD